MTGDLETMHALIRGIRKEEEKLAHQRKQLERHVRERMTLEGTDRIVSAQTGKSLFILSNVIRTGVDKEALQEKWPDVYALVKTEKSYESFRVEKG